MLLFQALKIYLGTQYSWATAWRHASDVPKHIDAPVYAVEREDGLEYVEISPTHPAPLLRAQPWPKPPRPE